MLPPRRPRGGLPVGVQIQIPVYILIFLLSVLGNVLVMVTLIQNKKMRTVTNVFLLNLAVSDLLLAVFCMPFTIIPILMQNFVFGAAMCVMIRYLQGVSVSVSCFTLVAISLERYFAICRPLQSRSWQTLNHAYRCIAVCWTLAAVFMIPLAVYHQLIETGPIGRCVEIWRDKVWEKAYTLLINLMLLVLPLILMSVAYGNVCYTLWIGIKLEAQSERERQQTNESGGTANYSSHNGVSLTMESRRLNNPSPLPALPATSPSLLDNHSYPAHGVSSTVSRPFRRFEAHRAMRQSNSEKSRAAKKRVIKMLFMIVIEFFIFWTPSYVIMTWIVFDRESANRNVSSMVKLFFHLLSYVSACCNPITYCFMNKNFRQGFLAAFRCFRRRHVYASRRSEFSFSGHTASTRTGVSSANTNYDQIRDSDEISEKSF
uniref:Gastrin/cholecystokinin type B receptor n=1 Tax=Rapana venosa TaxID=55521 RepID=A0A897PVU8_RAPVE|nr:cholecystokinin receptor [Rapana venosa]